MGIKMYIRRKLGGNWNNRVKCGSRSSNWNNDPLNLNSNNSSRGVADTEGYGVSMTAGLNDPLADLYTLSRYSIELTAKYTAVAPLGLVR